MSGLYLLCGDKNMFLPVTNTLELICQHSITLEVKNDTADKNIDLGDQYAFKS